MFSRLLILTLLPAALVIAPAAPAKAKSWRDWSFTTPSSANTSTTQESSIPLSKLPRTGQSVYGQILDGGPFRFEKDGTVFGNRERRLPQAARGYYREYTVPNRSNSRSRGAKRIVCGGNTAHRPIACYYSADHYETFARIIP